MYSVLLAGASPAIVSPPLRPFVSLFGPHPGGRNPVSDEGRRIRRYQRHRVDLRRPQRHDQRRYGEYHLHEPAREEAQGHPPQACPVAVAQHREGHQCRRGRADRCAHQRRPGARGPHPTRQAIDITAPSSDLTQHYGKRLAPAHLDVDAAHALTNFSGQQKSHVMCRALRPRVAIRTVTRAGHAPRCGVRKADDYIWSFCSASIAATPCGKPRLAPSARVHFRNAFEGFRVMGRDRRAARSSPRCRIAWPACRAVRPRFSGRMSNELLIKRALNNCNRYS